MLGVLKALIFILVLNLESDLVLFIRWEQLMNFLSVFVLRFPLFLCILKNNKNELSISFYASYNLFSSKQCDFCVKIFFFQSYDSYISFKNDWLR